MTAFQIPEAGRFEFELPGDKATYSIPALLDLPEDKISALMSVRGFEAQDIESLTRFGDMLASLADEGDAATESAIRKMSIRQKMAFIEAYAEDAGIEPGESPAS